MLFEKLLFLASKKIHKLIMFYVSGNDTQEGNHTIYASNSSGFIADETIIYRNESFPIEISISPVRVFRYLVYAPPTERNISEVCEIGIAGECYTLQKSNSKHFVYVMVQIQSVWRLLQFHLIHFG